MKRYVLKNLFKKSIALTLVLTFSYSQLLWAIDVRQMLIDAKNSFEEDTRRTDGMSAEQLQSAESQQQAAVDQQNALQELQGMNFNLTTQNGDILQYVGNALSRVQRPDGTTLNNIQQDPNGNIIGANLQFSDGSIQVFQNGQVIGYRTPDSTQVFYENGQIQKVITPDGAEILYSYIRDVSGNLIETILDSPSHQTTYDAEGKLKKVFNKSDGTQTFYAAGILQRVQKASGAVIHFNSEVINGDTVVTPEPFYQDAEGNQFLSENGAVVSVILKDGSRLENITWGADNKIDSATLLAPDGLKYIYQNRRLVESRDAAGVTTAYSYTDSRIFASSLGVTYEYLLDGTFLRSTDQTGSVCTYLTDGPYKGLKDKEITTQGIVYFYEYQTNADGSIAAQRRQALASINNQTSVKGSSNISYSTNPSLKFSALFADDGSSGQSVTATATNGSGKTLSVNLLPGAASTFTFNGVKKFLGVTLNKGTSYKVEIRWEPTRAAIYVYDASLPVPTVPAATITDRAWNPKFTYTAANASVIHDPASSGTYAITATVADKNSAYQPESPILKTGFRLNTSSTNNKIVLTAAQSKVGSITRTLTFTHQSGKWTLKRSDAGTSTSVLQTLNAGKDYVAELRVENLKANLYVYEKGQARPSSPLASLVAFDTSTKLTASFTNAVAYGQILKSLTVMPAGAVTAKALTGRVNFLQNASLTKPDQSLFESSYEFSSLTYDADSRLKEILNNDGSKLLFEGGELKQALDPDGNVTTFDVSQSALSNILGSQIAQNGLVSSYDTAGHLSSVALDGLTIHYKPGSNEIDAIEKEDGTELYNLTFDANGQIVNAEIALPDGRIRVYENGHLVRTKEPDLTQLYYLDDKPITLVTPQNLTYNFNYTPDLIEAILQTPEIPDALTTIKMEYDQNFHLLKTIRQNNEIIKYLENGKIDEIGLLGTDADGKSTYTLKQDFIYPDGSYGFSIKEEDVETFYDANNQPTKSIITPEDADDPDLEVIYRYGKIREIYKVSGEAEEDKVRTLVFKYSYSFDSQGEEITQIDEMDGKDPSKVLVQKIYKAGNLLTSFDKEASVLSTYSYADGKVSEVKVTRLGRLLHTYTYAYSGDLTIVTDEKGIVRTYGENKKLVFLERDKSKFAYFYHLQDGEEFVEENLIEKTLSDGSLVHYDKGRVTKVDNRPDGSVITDIVLDDGLRIAKATIDYPSGVRKIFDQNTLLEEIDPDGRHFYFDNGRISKLIQADGEELIYSYDTDPGANVTAVWVKTGDANLKYDLEGNLLGLELDDVPVIVDGSKDFTDVSSTKYLITPYGDAHLDTAQAKGGIASGYFDGSGDYLSIPDSGDWDYGTGDFTIEFSVKLASTPGSYALIDSQEGANGITISNSANSLKVIIKGTTYNFSWTPLADTWYHVALTREKGNLRAFINGAQIGTTQTSAQNISASTKTVRIGKDSAGSADLNGWMDEIRISKGIARYTQGFTPADAAYEPDPYTKLLLHFDGLDKSFYPFKKQTDAQAAVTGFSFEGDGGKISFDAQGNLLSQTVNSSAKDLINFYDYSLSSYLVMPSGDTRLDTAHAFGAGSAFFDGSGDFLQAPDSADWDFGTGDFTVECSVKMNTISKNQAFIDIGKGESSSGGVIVSFANSPNVLRVRLRGNLYTFNWTPSTGQWYHIAVTRSGGSLKAFINGSQIGAAQTAGQDITGSAYPLTIGRNQNSTGEDLNGWIDGVRVSKGVARWTQNFTPPSAEYEPDAYTKLLLHFEDRLTPSLNLAAISLTGIAPSLFHLPYWDKMNFGSALGDNLSAEYRYGSLYAVRDASEGKTYYYQNGALSKVTDAGGKILNFSYSKDSHGMITTAWVDNGLVRLKYDPDGHLLGFKRDGFLDANEVKSQTSDLYKGGFVTGYRSIDGDFATSQYESLPHSSGGAGSVSSEHDFPSPQTVTSITFKMYAYGRAGGNYIADYEAYYYVDVYRNGKWERVPGSFGGTYKINGTGSYTANSGVVTLNNLNLQGVTAIRAEAHGFGNSSDNANADGAAAIYEIQWSVADLANYTLSTQKDAQGQVTSYTFQGFSGKIQYDALGNLTSTPPLDLAKEAESLKGVIASYAALPYTEGMKLGIDHRLDPSFITLLSAAQEAIPGAQTVVAQEYSQNGVLETVTKGDRTVTLFDDQNRPLEVLDDKGFILIEYSYDSEGHPSKVYLKNARDTLPGEILAAQQAIEENRANALLELAQQKNLAYQSIKEPADKSRKGFQDQLSGFQDQFNEVSSLEVHGSAARSQKGNALNQIGRSMDALHLLSSQLSTWEADSYAKLDSQVQAISDQIKSDAQSAFTALSFQEANLKKEILRQEVSPIIYDYYRRILGRDPSSEEYDYWIQKIDYDTGNFITGETVTEEFKPGASAYFDGQGDYLDSPYSADWNLGGGDWTIDGWVKVNVVGVDQTLVSYSNSNNDNMHRVYISSTNKLVLYLSQGGTVRVNIAGTTALQAGVWYHWAAVKQGTAYRVYLNGKNEAQGASSTALFANNYVLRVGNIQTANAGLKGWLDEVRISKGIARYTTDFTPSFERIAPDSYAKLLLRSGSSASVPFKDVSSQDHSITLGGDSRVDTTQYKTQEKVIVHTPITREITQVLKEYIEALPELQERQAYVQNVKQKVIDKINQYLLMSEADREAFASALGLAANELITLSESDAQKILAWLESRSLHFGQSAFLSLEELLDQKGIHYAREDIAEKSILIDILTGVISPLDDGDLVISIFALNKVAQGYGLALNGANLTWEDLLAIYQANPNARVIAHISGIHFVIITSVQDDRITYIDPGIGKDKENESLTVTKEGFLKVWKGNVTLEQNIIQPLPSYQNKILSAEQTMNIRGAFWGSLLGLIGFVVTIFIPVLGPIIGFAIMGFIQSALQIASLVASIIEKDWLSAATAVVTLGFSNFGQNLGTFFHGATEAMGTVGQALNGVGKFFGSVFQAVQGFFGDIGTFFHGISNAITTSAIGSRIIETAIGVGINFGVSKGLEAIGVNPQIAGFLGSFVAGGIIGGMKGNTQDLVKGHVVLTSIQQNIQANIQQVVTLNQIGRLGLELGIDPGLTNILGLSLAAIQGQQILNPGTSLETAFSNIRPQIFSSLAQYGVEKLGTSLGFDPRVTSLIGSPISGLVGASFQQGFDFGQNAIAAINNGLLRGASSLGINYATQAAGLDPILGALAARSITGAIAGLFQVPQPNPYQDPNNPNDDFLTPHNIFEGLFMAFRDSALNLARLGISGTDAWSQAQYLQRVQNFSNIVQTRGFGQAIEDSATQILTEDSISSILRTTNPITQRFFQSIKEFFDYKNTANQFETLVVDGKTYKKILLPNGDYQTFTEDSKDVVEIKKGNQILRGTFAKGDNGEWGLKTGTIIVRHPNGATTTSLVENGKRTSVDIFNPNKILSESPDFTIRLNSDQIEIAMDSNGNLVNGLLQNNETGEGFVIKDSKLVSYLAGTPLSSDFEQQFMAQYGIGSTDITRPSTYENFVNGYPELSIDNSALPDGLSLKSESRFMDQFVEGATKLSNIKKVAEMVNALEAQMGGARLERVVKIVNGEAREYVKVLGQQNNFFKVAGRWYRIDNPAVAKYFSSSAAFAGKLTQGVGMTASIVIAQNVLDRVKNGEDILNVDFGVDAAVDLAVAVGTGAVAAATTAALVSAGFVSAAPIVVVGMTIAIGYGLTVLADRFIDELQIKEWLSQRANYLFNAG